MITATFAAPQQMRDNYSQLGPPSRPSSSLLQSVEMAHKMLHELNSHLILLTDRLSPVLRSGEGSPVSATPSFPLVECELGNQLHQALTMLEALGNQMGELQRRLAL